MKKNDYVRLIVVWILALIGIVLIMYPLVSTYYNDYNQKKD